MNYSPQKATTFTGDITLGTNSIVFTNAVTVSRIINQALLEALYTCSRTLITQTALTPYVTSAKLTTTLRSYVKSIHFTTTLGGYVKTTDLTTTLGGYVSTTDLTTTLENYVPKSGGTLVEIYPWILTI